MISSTLHKWLSSVLIATSLSACVLKGDPPRSSRFFADYSEFQKVDLKEETLVYRHPTTRVTDYNKFFIPPVSVYANPHKKIKDDNRPYYDELEEGLRGKLVNLLSTKYEVVDAIGPGVLKLEYAVIDIKPYEWHTQADGNRVFRADKEKKGSKFELDCHDGVSGERIFAISTTYQGDEYRAYQDTELIPNIHLAFNKWAKFLDTLLIQAKQDRAKAAAEDKAASRPKAVEYAPDKKDSSIMVYHHPTIRVLDYKQFYVPIPQIPKQKSMSEGDRKALGLRLRNDTAKTFQAKVKLVNHPGAGILTMRTRIEDSPISYKFHLECIDPKQGELIFGLIQTLPRTSLKVAFRKWNTSLAHRLEEAQALAE